MTEQLLDRLGDWDVVIDCPVCQGDTLKGWGLSPETFGFWRCWVCGDLFILVDGDDGAYGLEPMERGAMEQVIGIFATNRQITKRNQRMR